MGSCGLCEPHHSVASMLTQEQYIFHAKQPPEVHVPPDPFSIALLELVGQAFSLLQLASAILLFAVVLPLLPQLLRSA